MAPEAVQFFQRPAQPEQARQLTQWLSQHSTGGVFAWVAESDTASIPWLQQQCRQRGLPLLGAVFPELIWQGRFRQEGLLLLTRDPMPAHCIVENLHAHASPQTVVEPVNRLLATRDDSKGKRTLFLLYDALVPTIASQLACLYATLGDEVRYLGANAGSESFQPMACLFDQQHRYGNALLAMLLEDSGEALLEHGYTAPDEPVAATATEGNRIISIDWRPAFEVYTEHVAKHYGQRLTRDNFYRLSVHFPFGMLRANGETVVRIPVRLEPDGSLFCVGEVPENAVLTLMEAVEPDSGHTIEALTQRLGPMTQDEILLHFYCAGRRLHLGEKAAHELATLQRRVSPATLAGALSLGEIAPAREGDYPLFHNASLLCSRWRTP